VDAFKKKHNLFSHFLGLNIFSPIQWHKQQLSAPPVYHFHCHHGLQEIQPLKYKQILPFFGTVPKMLIKMEEIYDTITPP